MSIWYLVWPELKFVVRYLADSSGYLKQNDTNKTALYPQSKDTVVLKGNSFLLITVL